MTQDKSSFLCFPTPPPTPHLGQVHVLSVFSSCRPSGCLSGPLIVPLAMDVLVSSLLPKSTITLGLEIFRLPESRIPIRHRQMLGATTGRSPPGTNWGRRHKRLAQENVPKSCFYRFYFPWLMAKHSCWWQSNVAALTTAAYNPSNHIEKPRLSSRGQGILVAGIRLVFLPFFTLNVK